MSATYVTATEVQKSYLAYFGRPADVTGLNYWIGRTSAAMDAGFSASAEYAGLYAGMTNVQRVEQVYHNLLGRASDTAGSAYWTNALNNGSATVSSLVTSMQNNALGVDTATIANRTTYATLYTASMDTPAEIQAYTGDAVAAAARSAVSAVTYTDASLTTARTTIAADIATVNTGVAPAVAAAAAAAADTTAPTISSAAVAANGLSIVVTYSEALTGTAEFGDYAVTLGSGSTAVTGATIGSGADANKVTLTVSNAIADTATVSNLVYTATTGTANSIKDTAANSAATQTLASVTNVSTVPSFTLTTSAPIITEIMVGGAITKAMTFTLTLGSAPAGEVTVDYATLGTGSAAAGSDFVATTGTVTFVAGQTVANVTVVVNTDAAAEADETVAVLFSGTSLVAPVTGTGTILANDTAGLTVVLTAGTNTPVLGLNDDTINSTQAVPVQLDATDTVAGGAGTDTLTITPTIDTAFTLDDLIFGQVSGIDKIVIADTGTGGQTITTAGLFQAAFGTAGVDLQTTATTAATGTGMVVNLSAVTGPLTLTTTTTTGAQTITTGNGNATVFATATTGSVGITTGTGADVVTLTTLADTAGVGCVINTGAGNDIITIVLGGAAATSIPNLITGGLGADTITLSNDAEWNTIVIGNADSGITLAGADSITGFVAATDTLKMGTAAAATGAPTTDNYVEAVAAVADFAAALSAANIQLAALATATTGPLEAYAFQWVTGTNGYLFNDTDGSGTADQVVVLVGIDNTGIAFGDIIA